MMVVARSRFPPYVVDDVVQETMVAVYQKLPVWERGRTLRSWIVTVARNKAIDAMREARLHQKRPLEEIDDLAEPSAANAAEYRMDIARLMALLSPRSREIVTALALHGECVEDVAARLRLSHGAVRVALHRAIRQMGGVRRSKTDGRRQDISVPKSLAIFQESNIGTNN